MTPAPSGSPRCPLPTTHWSAPQTTIPRLQMWTKWGLTYFNQQLRAAKTQAKLHYPDIWSFSAPKLSSPMTTSPHKRPYYTESVWVFFVHIRLRYITLKMLTFFQNRESTYQMDTQSNEQVCCNNKTLLSSNMGSNPSKNRGQMKW